MERSITRTLFVELSLSFLGFLLLVSLLFFLQPKNTEKYATAEGSIPNVAFQAE